MGADGAVREQQRRALLRCATFPAGAQGWVGGRACDSFPVAQWQSSSVLDEQGHFCPQQSSSSVPCKVQVTVAITELGNLCVT